MYVAVPPATWSSSTKIALQECILIQHVFRQLRSAILPIRTNTKYKETVVTILFKIISLACYFQNFPQNSHRRRQKTLHLIQRLGLSRCLWRSKSNLRAGGIRLVRGQVNKVAGRSPQVGLSSYFPSSRILSRSCHSAVTDHLSPVQHHWQLFPNWLQAADVCPLFQHLQGPAALSSVQSVLKHTYQVGIYLFKHFYKFCVLYLFAWGSNKPFARWQHRKFELMMELTRTNWAILN
jgi:hypothetical protein